MRLEVRLEDYNHQQKQKYQEMNEFERDITMGAGMFLAFRQIEDDPFLSSLCEGYGRWHYPMGNRENEMGTPWTDELRLTDLHKVIDIRAKNLKQPIHTRPTKPIQKKFSKLMPLERIHLRTVLRNAIKDLEMAEATFEEGTKTNVLESRSRRRQTIDAFEKLVYDYKKSSDR